MHIFSFSRSSKILFHYGIFAVLCQGTAILLLASMSQYTNGAVLFHRFFPMLEHSLMSFSIIFIGVLGIEYIEKSNKK